MAIGISKGYVRVQLNHNYYDAPITTTDDDDWHFVHLCLRQSQITQDTTMMLWIDETAMQTAEFEGVFTDSSTDEVHVGKDFQGVIRTLAISQNMDWECSKEEEGGFVSPHVTTGCKGGCKRCSSIQYPTMSQAGECFSQCPQNTYDNECSTCDFRCSHCKGPAPLDCLACDPLTSFKNSSGLCQCAPGFFTDTNKCSKCNESCALCVDSSNRCVICAAGNYRIYDN